MYEEDIHVIVREKANAEVKFGSGLYLVEQEDGLIVDWQFFSGISHGGCALLATMQSDSQFLALQKRRAQTEGRIGILKNDYTGNPLNCRGCEHREKALAWSVLAHNLWTLGTMARKARREKEATSLDKAA